MKSVIAFFLLITLLQGCHQDDHDEHDHADEEHFTVSRTVYTDEVELFVEYPPLVVGHACNLVTHVTRVGETFLPVVDGTVSLRLIVNNETIRKTVDKSDEPGIFPLSIKPTTAGIGKLIVDVRAKGISEEIVIDSIEVFENEEFALASRMQTEGTINFSKEQSWKIEFASSIIKTQNFHEVIRASGQLSARPSDEHVVTARSNGVVVWNDAIVPGAEVKSGQRLFVLASGNVGTGNTETQYREARLNLERAEADYNRVKPLVADKIISQKDYLEIQTRYEQARIQFQTLSQNYTQGGQSIQSPSTGFVKQVNVRSGEYVEAGTPLVVITKDQSLQMEIEVPLRYAPRMPFIQEANFRTLHDNKVYSTEKMNGKVISYGKAISEESSLLRLYFSLKNDGSIIPGDAVEVYLKSRPVQNALVVPVSALLEEQGNFYVLVQHSGEAFEKRRVKLGGDDGMAVQVISGLREGERIVTKGAYTIKLASQTSGVPAHHHH
jgi:membrane fusion protein, heavy metal efflux system